MRGLSVIRAVSRCALVLGIGVPTLAWGEGFPAMARVASGFGYYNVDRGFDDRMALYGTLDAFASYHD